MHIRYPFFQILQEPEQDDFDLTQCYTDGTHGQIYDFYFTMKGPFEKLPVFLKQGFADAIQAQIQAKMTRFNNKKF